MESYVIPFLSVCVRCSGKSAIMEIKCQQTRPKMAASLKACVRESIAPIFVFLGVGRLKLKKMAF